jgi:hypothetical protein
MTLDLPKPTNRYTDLSRAELERWLWAAEAERAAVRLRLTIAEERLTRLLAGFQALQELADEDAK